MDEPTAPDAPAEAAKPDFVGSIDGIQGDMLSGWAVSILGDPCEVAVIVNGSILPAVRSELPRPDLNAKGQARGQGGWQVPVGELLTDGENRIDARLPDGTPLAGSPALFSGRSMAAAPPPPDAPLRYLGNIDSAQPPVLGGWALSSACRAVPVTVEIEGRAPVEVPSSDPRPDLAAKSLTPGDGGWHFDIGAVDGAYQTIVHLRFPDGSPLPGSPLRFGTPAAPPASPTEPPALPPVPEPVTAAPSTPAPEASAPVVERRPEPRAEPAPPPASVTRLNPRPSAFPTLAELDEISLDDLALAVENGQINVEAPPPPPPPEPEETAEIAAPPPRPGRKGLFARLLGR